MKRLNSLHDLYIESLRDIYHAEHQLLKALPKMAKATASQELEGAFEEHLEQTRGQIARLDEIFELNGLRPKGKKCVAMEGLIDEGKEMMSEDAAESVMDAALIASAQKVEHYEIAAYGTLRTWAQLMGHQDQARLLEESLKEEKQTDANLTRLAKSINVEAEEEECEEETH